MSDSYELNKPKSSKKKVVSRTICIVLVFVALIAGGAAGYVYGTNSATSDLEKELQQKVASLEEEINKTKAVVGDELQEGQDNVEEGQQTLDELQNENTELKQTVEELNTKIADLEKQLEEANNSTTNP